MIKSLNTSPGNKSGLFLFVLVGLLLFVFSNAINAQQNKEMWYKLIGSAYVDNQSYAVLQRICDEAAGRLLGSPENARALDILESELKTLGVDVVREEIIVPGWKRGNDVITINEPFQRKLRAAALGYTQKADDVNSELIFAGIGAEEDYDSIDVSGKIVLVDQSKAKKGVEVPFRSEAIIIAASQGAKAILFKNKKMGGLLLCGTSSFKGTPTKIPAYTITYEEGSWLKRLIDNEVKIKMTVHTESYCIPELKSQNMRVTLPGKSDKRIIIGAHVDSWDLGNGGVDNGLGTVILFDLVRLIKKFSPENHYSIDFVWFNGEELGLWGAKKYAEAHSGDDIVAMINMDMTGSPTGFNIMGFEEFEGFFGNLQKSLDGFNLSKGVTSNPWTNSDHMPFMLKGIPSFTLHAKLEKDMYWYYHDFGDTFDKVDRRFLSDAAAVISVTLYELLNDKSIETKNRSDEEMIEFLKEHKLEKKLKRQGEYPF